MQQRRNIRLFISLLILIAVNVVLFFSFNAKEKYVVDPSLFKVNDLTKIDEVILTRKGKTIQLKFDGSRWTVNNQLADRRMIDVLFATLQQVQPKRPVAETLQDSINKILSSDGVAVKLLAANEQQMDFTVGGNAAKTQAYFYDKKSDQSYLVTIPGYRVYAGGIFELDDGGWKDKYVFNFNWSNFQSLKATYPENPKGDFEVVMGKDYFEVKGVASIDTTKLNDFLDAVSLLAVDRYATSEEITVTPGPSRVVRIEVNDISGKSYLLDLYEYKDSGAVVGSIQDSQWAFFDRKKLAAIAKSRTWFEKK